MANGAWPMAKGEEVKDQKGKPQMAKYRNFEELPVWQGAARLHNATLDLLQQRDVPITSGFRSQLDRQRRGETAFRRTPAIA